jgi:hypothetical protein
LGIATIGSIDFAREREERKARAEKPGAATSFSTVAFFAILKTLRPNLSFLLRGSFRFSVVPGKNLRRKPEEVCEVYV